MVCAYKESPYLEECVRSLKGQSISAQIKVATSTPNDHISDICSRYGLSLYVNPEQKGIAGDWNFALSAADTPLVTIAHQDDIYEPSYAEKFIEYANRAKDPIILFSDYGELRNGERVFDNKLLKIKRFLLKPLNNERAWEKRGARRRVLSKGSPICCPSVTYVKAKIPEGIFDGRYKVSLDWAAWEQLSKLEGSFVYIPEPLMLHRIHVNSETTKQIEGSVRSAEDYEMFRRFWPAPIAGILAHFYRSSEKSNKI